MLSGALENGDFELRGPLGQRFQRSMAKDDKAKAEYALCTTYEAKRDFRQKWATMKYQDIRRGKSYSKSWRNIDATKGTYLPLAKIIEEEGWVVDKKSAVAAGVRLATQCLTLGGQWVMKDQFTGQLNFLRLRRQHNEEMVEAWTTYMKAGDSTDNRPEEILEKPTPRNKNPKERTPLDDAMVATKSLKAIYQQATSSASTIVGNIKNNDAGWDWAHNDANLGALQQMHTDLTLDLDDFARQFLLKDGKDIKKAFGADHLILSLARFNSLRPKVENLQKKVTKMLAMHAANTT